MNEGEIESNFREIMVEKVLNWLATEPYPVGIWQMRAEWKVQMLHVTYTSSKHLIRNGIIINKVRIREICC